MRHGGIAMLVLSRKNLESVVIGEPDRLQHVLKVTVLEIHKGRVKLGFDVDEEVPIHRLEVWERIHGTETIRSSDSLSARSMENL
jgi:carbon storage regulator CsrA